MRIYTVRRLFSILILLAKHDCLFLLEKLPLAGMLRLILKPWHRTTKLHPSSEGSIPQLSQGIKLSNALEAMGPIGIKLGQALSVRSDIVGHDISDGLRRLQDRLPAFSQEIVKKTIETSFNKPLDALFSYFEETPVAAASIAQVHQAKTLDGEKVAVKILRPKIRKIFNDDLRFFKSIAVWLERHVPRSRRLRPVTVIKTVEEWVHDELDLLTEAAACDQLRQNFIDEDGFNAPKVLWSHCTSEVLTTSWVEGVRIDDHQALKEMGADRKDLLEKSARAFFLQVFRDGFFHADIHPGNMFVNKDHEIIAIDFGIMGHLDARSRFFLADILLGFLKRDYQFVSQVHFDYGCMSDQHSVEAFALALRAIGEPMLNCAPEDISVGRLLGRLFDTTEKFQMEVQPQLLLIQKTIVMAEGVGQMLDANTNMWVLAQPLIVDWVIANRGPEAQTLQFIAQLKTTLMDRLPHLLNLLEEKLKADLKKT